MSSVHTGVFRPLIVGVLLVAVSYGLIGVLSVLLIIGSLLVLRAVWVGRRDSSPRDGCGEEHVLTEGGRQA
jgi:hypothetical protein